MHVGGGANEVKPAEVIVIYSFKVHKMLKFGDFCEFVLISKSLRGNHNYLTQYFLTKKER